MIEEIRIRSLGVIEETVLELGPGLNCITGETGAGKTMVVSALGLLLGERADPGVVRRGADVAHVEGIVGLPRGLEAAVEEAGGDVEEGTVVLARRVPAEGRSRAFLGGVLVPAAVLADLGAALVAVHGQSDQHRLLRPEAQRAALDAFAGDHFAAVAERYRGHYREWREVETELHEVTSSARDRAREAELLRLGLAEIEQVAPEPDEDARLAREEARLGFAEELRTAAEEARTCLSGEDIDTTHGAVAQVALARRALEGVRDHDEEIGRLADRLAEVGYLLADIGSDVASYATGVEADPLRLGAVSERRAALTALTRTYGKTLDEVIAWSATAAARLVDLDDSDDRIDGLRARRDDLLGHLTADAGELSRLRTDAATKLADAVSVELAALAMPHARVEVVVSPQPDDDGLHMAAGRYRFGPDGIDRVELRLAANTGDEARPLEKGASGGELSRVMLAIEVVLADADPVPTFVFDEVDAGVGGRAAVEIGRRLAALARRTQVLVVTHLPQVAAFADRHLMVQKASDGSVTTSGLRLLDDAERVRELSRMLAGMESSDTALAHAEELLHTARHDRGA